MVRSVAVVLAAALLLASAGAAPLATASAGSDGAAPAVQSPIGATESPSFSSTHFRIAVHPNGSATWTFQYRTQLENDTERERFREYARSFEANETRFVEQFRANAHSLVADGEDVTGREMNATNFERAAFTRGLSDDLGVVQLSFTWTNFARTDGERVVVGDLFDGGLYLGSNQRLVVTADPELAFASVSPTPNATAGPTLAASDSVTWFGPREFTDERPRVVLVPNDSVGAGEGGATTGSPSTDDTDGSDALPVALLGGLLALLAVGGGVAYWQRERLAAALGGASDAGASPAADASRDPDAETAPVGDPAVSDEEMLADDERVERLLREHGGRMRQASIVEETDWSKSKVSMLLSEMEDDDRISRLRVGRENVVSLPGHEPTTGRDEE